MFAVIHRLTSEGFPAASAKAYSIAIQPSIVLSKYSLDTLKIPCHLEPLGISRVDGKRPDGMSLIPWKCGKSFLWDATCPDTLVPSYISSSSKEARSVANEAERKKILKYSNLLSNYFFIPIAIETLGAFGVEADHFICDIGHRLKELTLKPLSHFHLVQRISIAIQRGNALVVKGSMSCL